MPQEPPQDWHPVYDEEAVDRMERLRKALDEGRYEEEFDALFPPDELSK